MLIGDKVFRLLGALVLLSSLGLGWLWMEYEGFANEPLVVGPEGTTLLVPPGASLYAVAAGLHERGILERPRYFVWMARLQGQADRIKAGEYRIDAGMTPRRLLNEMTEGKVILYGLTVVEGWTFRQMIDAIEANDYLIHTFKGASDSEIMAAIGHAGEHPEGRFLPETYHFPRGTTDVAFLQRVYQAMARRLQEEWEGRAPGLPLESPYEALILASIVEKETGVPDERSRIAGVFVRRLKKGMRLQTDPTIIYGLGDSYDGNIRRRDLNNSDNPYNTYRHSGLPPTPIALPGPDAVRAALHPDDGESLYFVSKGDGSHHFSSTLDEHNNAVIRYQLKGRRRSFSSNP